MPVLRSERPSPQFGLCSIGRPIPTQDDLIELPSDIEGEKFFAGPVITFANFEWDLQLRVKSNQIVEMALIHEAAYDQEDKRVFIFAHNHCQGLWGEYRPYKNGDIQVSEWLVADGTLTLELRPPLVILRVRLPP
jgi:hypothetical protein